jgi:glycosyltransferase involved in cell wall biosynthesis
VVSFSVIIVTHGRTELLIKCLESLSFPNEEWQLILIANGEELTSEVQSKASLLTPNLKMITTETQLSPGKARNVGILEAESEWIFFLDDDAYLLKGYWEVAKDLLADSKIDVLGGPDSPAKGMSALSLSLALALSSPFCTGVTSSRHKSVGKNLAPADEEKLTSCNLWVRKSKLDGIIFPEDYYRAEETIFLQKLKKAGVGMYYHPRLKVAHNRRSRLKHLFKPTFYAGYYRSKLMKEKLKSGNEAFWLPALFVLLHLLIFLDQEVFWYLARMYASIVAFVSIGIAMRAKRFYLFPVITFFHYFIVFIYGTGFLYERLSGRRK